MKNHPPNSQTGRNGLPPPIVGTTGPAAALAASADLARPVGARSICSHVCWSYAAQALTVASGILLAHGLGPHQRGLLAAALLWPQIIAGLGLLGVPMALLVRIRREPRHAREYAACALRTALWLALMGCLAGYCLMPYLIPQSAAEVLPWSRLYLGMLPFSHAGIIAAHVLVALGRLPLAGLLNLFAAFSYVLLLTLCWIAGRMTFAAALIATLASTVMANSLNTILLLSLLGNRRKTRRSPALWREAGPHFAEQLTGAFNQQLEQWLLLCLLTPEALGCYVVSLSFAGLTSAFANSINTLGLLEFSRLALDQAGRRTIAAAFRQAMLVQWLPAVVLAALAPMGIPLLLGKTYQASVYPALILLLAAVIKAQTNLLLTALRSTGNAFAGGILQFSRLAVLGLLAVPGIYWAGVNGLALASVLAALGEMGTVFYGLRRYGFRVAQFLSFGQSDFFSVVGRVAELRLTK